MAKKVSQHQLTMLTKAAACFVFGIGSKYVSSTLEHDYEELLTCQNIATSEDHAPFAEDYGFEEDSSSAPERDFPATDDPYSQPAVLASSAATSPVDTTYGYFRGKMNSDQPKNIKDGDTGLELSVVAYQKKMIEEYVTKTTVKGEGEESGRTLEKTKRGERTVTDTGKQLFGSLELTAQLSPQSTAVCALRAVQAEVPLRKVFSSHTPAYSTRISSGISDLTGSESKSCEEVTGLRTDVYAATVGEEVTVIGDFTRMRRRASDVDEAVVTTYWTALPTQKKCHQIVYEPFEKYKADKASSSSLFGVASCGFFVLGSIFGYLHKQGVARGALLPALRQQWRAAQHRATQPK